MTPSRWRRIISPVFTKELVQIATQKRGAWTKLLFLGVLLLATFIMLWDYDKSQAYELTSLGREYFTALCTIQMIATIVLTPLVSSGAIAGEREANTLGLLLLSRLRPRNIAQDKALSRITQMLYLNGLAFPFLALALLLGGIEWHHVASAILYILGTVIIVGGVSVFFSSIRQNHVRAAASAYVYLFLAFILSTAAAGALIAIFESTLLRGPGTPTFDVRVAVGAINPAFGLVFLLEPYSGFQGFEQALASAGIYVAMSLAVYVVCIALAARVIKRHIRKGPVVHSTAKPADESAATGTSAAPAESVPWRQRLTRPIRMKAARMLDPRDPVSFNPLKALGRLARLAGKHKIVTVLILGILGLPAVTGGWEIYLSMPFYVIFYVFAGPLLGITVVLKAATCFSQDKQNDRFAILTATRYRGADVVRGTYRAIWYAVYPYVLVFVLVMLIGALVIDEVDYYNDDLSVLFPFMFVIYINFIIVIGMRVSLFCKSNARAIAALFGVLAAVCLWPLLVALVLDPFISGSAEDILLLSPAAMLGPGLFADELSSAFRDEPFLCVIHVVLILGTSIAYYVLMLLRYDKIVGRQPGMSGGRQNVGRGSQK